MHPIFQQYLERLNRLNRDHSTKVNFRRVAEEFTSYCTAQGIDPLRSEGWMVEEFLAQLTWANSTKRVGLANLRAAYRYAHQRRLIERVPTSYVQVAREADTEPVVIPCAELRAIKARCTDEQQWLLFHLYAYTGMRMSEGRLLDTEAVNLSGNTLRVEGKGGKLRLVPIHPALGEVLTRDAGNGHILGNGRALTSQALYYRLHKIAPDRSFHDFRRTVASSLYANGVQPDTIDKIMGWAPRTVRSRYYQRIADEQLQEAILCLYADDPV